MQKKVKLSIAGNQDAFKFKPSSIFLKLESHLDQESELVFYLNFF